MRLKIVNPIRSMQARSQMLEQGRNPKFGFSKKGIKHNPHGIGGPLTGDKSPNPTGKGGFGDNPSAHVITARYLNLIKNTPFKPGNCANPWGRAGRKGAGVQKVEKEKPVRRSLEGISIVKEAREIKEMAAKCVPDAIQALHEIIKSDVSSDMAKIAASNAVWDRGYGRATQTNVTATLDLDAKPNEISDAELDRRVGEALERVESITKRTREKIIVQERSSDLRKLN